jgi:hypothetical protein
MSFEKDWLKDNGYQEYLNSASKETARRYYRENRNPLVY